MQLPESSLRLQNRVVWPLVTLFQTNRAPVTIGYLQRGVFTAGGERASLLIRASIRCYPPATEQYADFADRRIYPRMLRIAADLPADYADFTNGFWGVQIDGFFRWLLPSIAFVYIDCPLLDPRTWFVVHRCLHQSLQGIKSPRSFIRATNWKDIRSSSGQDFKKYV